MSVVRCPSVATGSVERDSRQTVVSDEGARTFDPKSVSIIRRTSSNFTDVDSESAGILASVNSAVTYRFLSPFTARFFAMHQPGTLSSQSILRVFSFSRRVAMFIEYFSPPRLQYEVEVSFHRHCHGREYG